MQHFVSDYSDRELILAIASPHLTFEREIEITAEILHRKFLLEQDLADIIAN